MAVGLIISYLILAANNFFWNIKNIDDYAYCRGEEPDVRCIHGLYAIFTAVAIDYRDQASMVWGATMILIFVNFISLRKHFKSLK